MSEFTESDKHIESRVAKTEAALESVTRDIGKLTEGVQDLSNAVREQGQSTDAQIRNMLVAVTAASGPRKTEWGTVVSSIMVVLAIGTAAFAPVLLRVADLETRGYRNETVVREHEKLQMHPVGHSRVDALEIAQSKAVENRGMEIKRVETHLEAAIADLSKQLARLEDQGAPITRQRLSILELQVKSLSEAARPAK